jgi:hypothetical protein
MAHLRHKHPPSPGYRALTSACSQPCGHACATAAISCAGLCGVMVRVVRRNMWSSSDGAAWCCRGAHSWRSGSLTQQRPHAGAAACCVAPREHPAHRHSPVRTPAPTMIPHVDDLRCQSPRRTAQYSRVGPNFVGTSGAAGAPRVQSITSRADVHSTHALLHVPAPVHDSGSSLRGVLGSGALAQRLAAGVHARCAPGNVAEVCAVGVQRTQALPLYLPALPGLCCTRSAPCWQCPGSCRRRCGAARTRWLLPRPSHDLMRTASRPTDASRSWEGSRAAAVGGPSAA